MGNLTSTQLMNPGSCSPIFLAKTVDEEMHREITSLPWMRRGSKDLLPRYLEGFGRWNKIMTSASFAYPATEVTSAAMPSPMPQGSLSETACNRLNTFFWQSLTVLRRYLEHQNIPIKHQTSTIMAACLGSCTATILLVD